MEFAILKSDAVWVFYKMMVNLVDETISLRKAKRLIITKKGSSVDIFMYLIFSKSVWGNSFKLAETENWGHDRVNVHDKNINRIKTAIFI